MNSKNRATTQRGICIYIIGLLLLICSSVNGQANQAKKWEGQWTVAGKSAPYIISLDETVKQKAPVVVYLTGLKIRRIGTDSDQTIIADLIGEGYMVVQLDCGSLPQSSPEREEALADFNKALPKYLVAAIGTNTLINPKDICFIPAGYRIARNQPYWNIRENGAAGTIEYIVKTYNKHIVEKYKVPAVETPEEMKGPNGKELDYNLRMDIIYPSGNASSVPLVVNFSTQSTRMAMFSAAKKGSERMVYPIGFLTSGYAWANVDHNFNPLTRDETYGYMDNIYTLDHLNGLASSTAAIRFLRAHAKQYHLNGKIGAMGISKASYSVARLADPDNATLTERIVISKDRDKRKTQPWPGYASNIDVGYTAAGEGIRRLQYFNNGTVPLVTSAGRFDQFKMWNRFPTVTSKFEEVGINYLDLWMEDLGHTYPVGIDFATGQDRYGLVKRFFDQNLYPHNQKDLEVLYILPSNGNKKVAKDGKSDRFAENVPLPPEMLNVPVSSPITIRFARSIKPESISGTTVCIQNIVTKEDVPGKWHASLKNTRFEFFPSKPLESGKTYSIILSGKIEDTQGNLLKNYPTSNFTVVQ